VDDANALCLRPPWFFNQPARIIRVAGQQHNRALSFESGGGNNGVDGAAVSRKASGPEQFASVPAGLRAHRHDGDPG
jgi:hypothetical protein